MQQIFVLCFLVLIAAISLVESQSKEFWFNSARDDLKKTLAQQLNTNVAKNLVLVIGDGMGVTTTTAGRIYRGQKTSGLIGEEADLSWDVFPHIGLSRTYTTNAMTADSAASGTAYHTGAKTKNGVVGLDDNVILGDCSSTAGANTLSSIAQWARAEGKSVGIITTDRLSGASPSPLYAKAAARNWYDDSDLPDAAKGICKDIAVQILEEENLDIKVLLGGGRAQLLPNTMVDPEYPEKKGYRRDGRNLAEEWVAKQQAKGRTAKFVFDQAGFDNAKDVDCLLGAFERSRVQDEFDRKQTTPVNEPSIAEMTQRAISILSKNPNGFYLFIEGANIDIGHHGNKAHKALEETLALDDAVQNVLDMTSTDDTLVVVSADHSHEFSFGAYSLRGESILGLVKTANPKKEVDFNGNPFTVISYGNGPGNYKGTEINEANFINNPKARYMSAVPLKSETHSGEDVAIFASGPMSHLFTGVHEQNYLPHAMAYAACIGENKDHCKQDKPLEGNCDTNGQCQRFSSCVKNVCRCQDGYELVQEQCVLVQVQGDCDVDGQCQKYASCVNNLCSCNQDYQPVGKFCTPIGKPSESFCADHFDCIDHASCINNECLCDKNYFLQNGVCVPDTNGECSRDYDCGRNGLCVNNYCECDRNYVLQNGVCVFSSCRASSDCERHEICVRGRRGQNYCKCRRNYELKAGICKPKKSTEED